MTTDDFHRLKTAIELAQGRDDIVEQLYLSDQEELACLRRLVRELSGGDGAVFMTEHQKTITWHTVNDIDIEITEQEKRALLRAMSPGKLD